MRESFVLHLAVIMHEPNTIARVCMLATSLVSHKLCKSAAEISGWQRVLGLPRSAVFLSPVLKMTRHAQTYMDNRQHLQLRNHDRPNVARTASCIQFDLDLPHQALQALLFASRCRASFRQTARQVERIEGGAGEAAGLWVH